MKRRRLTVLLAGLVLSVCVSATDNLVSASDLLDMGIAWENLSTQSPAYSRDPHATGKASTYMGYVQGVGEATVGTYWCAKPNMKVKDVASAVLLELKAAPARNDLPALEAVRTALSRQFPCSKA